MVNAAAEATAAVVKADKVAELRRSSTHQVPNDGHNGQTKMDQSTEKERDATWEDIAGAMDSFHWG